MIQPEFKEWPKISRLNRDIVITEKIDGTNAAIGIVPEMEEFYVGPGIGDVGERESGRMKVYAQSRTRIIQPGKSTDNMGFAAWVKAHEEVLIKTLGPGLHFGEWWGVGIQRGYDLSERRFSLFNTAKWGSGEGALALEMARAQGAAIYSVPELYAGPWTGVLGYQNGPETEKPGEWMDLAAQADWDISADAQRVNRILEIVQTRLRMVGDGVEADEVIRELNEIVRVNPRPRFAPNFILEWLKRIGSQAAPGFMQPEGICVFHKASGMIFKATVEKDEKHKGEK